LVHSQRDWGTVAFTSILVLTKLLDVLGVPRDVLLIPLVVYVKTYSLLGNNGTMLFGGRGRPTVTFDSIHTTGHTNGQTDAIAKIARDKRKVRVLRKMVLRV
jgi:hypothetical protein